MADEAVDARKAQLREAAKRLRPRDTALADAEVVEALMGIRSWAAGEHVALYAASGHEVDTRAVFDRLRERGIQCVFPRVMGDMLTLHAVDAWSDLVDGTFGILEPGMDAPTIAPERVAVFLVPGLLFDRDGHRLGRGGGYYDRLLAQASPEALRIGLCHHERLVGEIPVARWDISVDFVVTDRELIRAEEN